MPQFSLPCINEIRFIVYTRRYNVMHTIWMGFGLTELINSTFFSASRFFLCFLAFDWFLQSMATFTLFGQCLPHLNVSLKSINLYNQLWVFIDGEHCWSDADYHNGNVFLSSSGSKRPALMWDDTSSARFIVIYTSILTVTFGSRERLFGASAVVANFTLLRLLRWSLHKSQRPVNIGAFRWTTDWHIMKNA